MRRKHLQRKFWECFIVLNLICGCFIYMIYIGTTDISAVENTQRWGSLRPYSQDYFSEQRKRKRGSSNWVRILFWTGYFEAYEFSAFGIDRNTFKDCSAKCQVTFDKRLLPISDAVVFHIRDIAKVGLPTYHAPRQLWIFYMLESADNTRVDLRDYATVFNWTMTYRRDSDIYHPYGRVEKVLQSNSFSELTPTRHPPVPTKSKLVAWVVSNCYTHSNRESYVAELEKTVGVDKYGSCYGDLKCVGETTAECYAYLARSYKFYLAFENSLCLDYVTEKFFECLHHDMVPVVYGGANYSAIGPPGSFIDTRDFESPKALGNYLNYLDGHPEEYSKYLRWKENYRIVPSDGWCSLCTKLKSNTGVKSYANIWEWWKTSPKGEGVESRKASEDPLENENRGGACLPVPEIPNESWVSRIRKKYFILRHE